MYIYYVYCRNVMIHIYILVQYALHALVLLNLLRTEVKLFSKSQVSFLTGC